MTLASCDSRKTAGENPFFTEWDTPHGVPPFDKILPEHFMPAFERGMSLHEAEIDAITSNKDEATFENTILAYDNAGQMLAQTELVFGMLCAAETNDRMQALQEQAMPLLAAHRFTTGVRRWGSTPSRCACCRKPTTPSCVPGRCSTPSRRPA